MEENNSIENIKSQVQNNNIVLSSNTTPYSEFFYFSNVFDAGEYKKFIKNTEKLIRKSREYKEYISDLCGVLEFTHDNILHNIDKNDCSIEIHHYPFTLYDIVDIVASYNIISGKQITTFSLAKEIMDLHFENKIGLTPLTITTHEMAHSGNLFLSTNQIFGDWEVFAKQYNSGISNELKEKIKLLKQQSSQNPKSDINGVFNVQ